MTFAYHTHAQVIFGQDAARHLGGLLREYGVTSILLVSSGSYVEDLGIRSIVDQAAAELGASVIATSEVVPNPRIDLVRSLIDQAREHHVDFVLGVGGASSMDTAKAVGVGVPYDGDVWDLFDGKAEPVQTLPVGVIPTIAGSGSEVSDCAVLQQGHDKRALETRLIIPRFALVDPAYSRTAPRHYQAAAIADLAMGFLEPYFTAKEHVVASDRLLEGGFVSAIEVGRRFAADPQDPQVRTDLHWLSATMFNHCWLATGSENDWTTHRIEHEIGGEFDVIHGEGITAILPSIIRVVSRRVPERYSQLASRAFGIDPFDHTPRQAAALLADKLEDYFKSLGLATSLHELDIPEEAIGHIADRLTHGGSATVGNFVPLNRADVVEVLEAAY